MGKPLILTTVWLVAATLLVSTASGQDFCCDPDAPGGVTGSFFECGNEDGGYLASDGEVCDADCAGYSSGNAACIPIDGGLSLLALAGGGLATAAMRRRREEEARQAEHA